MRRGAAGFIGAIRVVDNALAQTGQRNNSGLTLSSGVTTALVTIEKEELLLYDRAADPAAKCVPNQRCTGNPGLIAEPVVGREKRASVEFKRCPVPIVRT